MKQAASRAIHLQKIMGLYRKRIIQVSPSGRVTEK
jgi:hypothetical protein